MSASWWSADGSGVILTVRVVPGARRSEVAAGSGDTLRIRVAAPAHDGKANAELQRFVAKLFGVKRSAVTVVRGERSRDKVLHVAGVSSPPHGVA